MGICKFDAVFLGDTTRLFLGPILQLTFTLGVLLAVDISIDTLIGKFIDKTCFFVSYLISPL